MQAAVMNNKKFEKTYKAYEAVHGRQASDLEVDRAWSRYDKIVLQGK